MFFDLYPVREKIINGDVTQSQIARQQQSASVLMFQQPIKASNCAKSNIMKRRGGMRLIWSKEQSCTKLSY